MVSTTKTQEDMQIQRRGKRMIVLRNTQTHKNTQRGGHTFASTAFRPPKWETQDTVGFSTGSSENTRQKIISTKSTKNSKGNNQVYLHIKQCKQTTAIAAITLEKTSQRLYRRATIVPIPLVVDKNCQEHLNLFGGPAKGLGKYIQSTTSYPYH